MENIKEKEDVVKAILEEGTNITQEKIIELFMKNVPGGVAPHMLTEADSNAFLGMACLYYASIEALSDFAKEIQLQAIETFLEGASKTALKRVEMIASLTNQEKSVYDATKAFIDKNRYSPSVRELCKLCGFSSTNTAHKALHSLEEKGLISLSGKGARRSIRINP